MNFRNIILQATGRFGLDTLKGFQILIPTMSSITRELLAEADDLRLIQQCGVGLEGVDLEAARELNIPVANVPSDISGNADSVAELGIYLMIGLARDFRGMARGLAQQKMGEPQGRALQGLTVGLVGLGGIGRALIRRLRPFDVHLLGIKRNDPQKAKEELGLEWVGTPDDLGELLGRADFVILCLPVTGETKQMMNRDTLALMKPGAYLINLSRGGLVDREALEAALSSSGRIAGAGLDVFWRNRRIRMIRFFSTTSWPPRISAVHRCPIRGIVAAVAENIRRVARNQRPFI